MRRDNGLDPQALDRYITGNYGEDSVCEEHSYIYEQDRIEADYQRYLENERVAHKGTTKFTNALVSRIECHFNVSLSDPRRNWPWPTDEDYYADIQ
jgi:hypothetical protein